MSINTLNLLFFKIEDEMGSKLNFIPIRKKQKTMITIKCNLFVDNKSISMMKEFRFNRIYLNASYKNTYIIAHQFVDIPIEKMGLTNYLDVGFTFEVPYSISKNKKIDSVDITLAYSPKPEGEAGISESIRIGTFLKTTIPTSEVD